MTSTLHSQGRGGNWDAVVVGASLAGCSTAIGLARSGLRVALADRAPDAGTFKRICGHFIHPSALPTMKRLGLLTPLASAGAARSHISIRSPWGWIDQSPAAGLDDGFNLRREVMDPRVRSIAAETPGVELMLGWTADGLCWDGERVSGVRFRSPAGHELKTGAKLVVGADGRSSTVASLAGLPSHRSAHGRFSYATYYEDPRSERDVSRLWMADPQWGAEFPTDSGLTLYACMPTMDQLPYFKRDRAGAFQAFMAGLPDPPPIADARAASPLYGKISMPNVSRGPVRSGLALVGDAALAIDPLAGVGCGWAFEGAVRLTDAVSPALHGAEPLEPALRRYRRRHRRALAVHARMIRTYATGRPFNRSEQAVFSLAARDQRAADALLVFGSRSIGPAQMMASVLPRLLADALPTAGRRQGRGRARRTSASFPLRACSKGDRG